MKDTEKKLLAKIYDYETHILKYRKYLSIEGAILFVTSISILGVTQYPIMQKSAVILVGLLLVIKIYVYLEKTDPRTFPKIHEDLLKQIKKENIIERYHLERIEFEHMSMSAVLSSSGGFIFMSSIFYYAFTFWCVFT